MTSFFTEISKVLLNYGSVHFEEIDRNEDGIAIINDIEIVYKVSNSLSNQWNRARNDVMLVVDIWGFKSNRFKIESIISELEKLEGCKITTDDGIYLLDKDILFRTDMDDEDKSLKVIRLQFNVRRLK